MNSLSTTDTAALASLTNFLSSLTGGNSPENADATLFANFLSQSQNAEQNQAQSPNITASEPAPTSSTPASPGPSVVLSSSQPSETSPPNTPNTLLGLKKMVATWQHVVQKLQAQTKGKMGAVSKSSSPKSLTKSAPPSLGETSTSVNTLTETSHSASNTSQSSATGATATTADASNALLTSDNSGLNLEDPKTVAALLAELQNLAQLISKQLQTGATSTPTSSALGTTVAGQVTTTDVSPGASSEAAGTNAGQPLENATDELFAALDAFSKDLQNLENSHASANAAVTTDATASISSDAGDPALPTAQALTNLLALAQLISKQLDATQSSDQTSSATQAITASSQNETQIPTSTLLTTSAQATSSLQNILDSLKNNLTLTKQVKGAAGPSSAAANAKVLNSPSALSDAADTVHVGSASALTSRTSSLSQNNLSNLFSANAATSATASPPTPSSTLPNFLNFANGFGNSESDESGENAFDLSKDQQNANGFSSAQSQGTAANADNLPTALQSPTVSSPYSFASQLAAAKATGATGLPPAVEQVLLQLNRGAKSGNDQMTLQLNPAELGRVNIKLDISSDGKVQGTVVASNPETLNSLLKDVRSLERALQDAGLRADPGSLQFSLGEQSGQSSGQTASGSEPSSGQSTTQNSVADDKTSDPIETYYLTPGRVNLHV